jgi:hypothetical protein
VCEGVEGMAQIVECLPSNGKALSSNPSTSKKKKKILQRTLLDKVATLAEIGRF